VKVWRRGVTLFSFEAEGKDRTKLGVFDPYRIPEEADRLASVIQHLPAGTLVAMAVKDEASKHWTAKADQALRSLGGTASLIGKYRASYALIGVKGATPGQALEQFSANRPVSLVAGRLNQERYDGVAWSTIALSAPPDEDKKKKKKDQKNTERPRRIEVRPVEGKGK
jgi:hypothetical protein